MSHTTPPGVPPGTPLVTTENYAVAVRLLQDPRGILLIESRDEIGAKYGDLKDDARIRFASETPQDLADALARLDAAEAQEKDLFRQLEEQRGGEFQRYEFDFRVATVADHEAAEAEASRTQPRQELVYRRTLAQKTLKTCDYPGFKDFGSLRTDVALHVLRRVAERVTLSADARSFLLPVGAGSAGG